MINALCAIAVGIQNNIPAEKILEGISEFELTKNRMEIVDGKKGTKIINDSYNANYEYHTETSMLNDLFPNSKNLFSRDTDSWKLLSYILNKKSST